MGLTFHPMLKTWTALAIEPLLMAVGHSQWFAVGFQPYKNGRYSRATAVSWLLLATTTETTPCVHGGVAWTEACVELGGVSSVFKQEGQTGFASTPLVQQLSGVQAVDRGHPQ